MTTKTVLFMTMFFLPSTWTCRDIFFLENCHLIFNDVFSLTKNNLDNIFFFTLLFVVVYHHSISACRLIYHSQQPDKKNEFNKSINWSIIWSSKQMVWNCKLKSIFQLRLYLIFHDARIHLTQRMCLLIHLTNSTMDVAKSFCNEFVVI